MPSFNTCKGSNYLLKDWHYVNVTFAGPLNPVIKLLSKLFCNMNVACKKKSHKRNDCDIFWVCSISIMTIWNEQFVYITQNLNEIRRKKWRMWYEENLLHKETNLSQGFGKVCQRKKHGSIRKGISPTNQTCLLERCFPYLHLWMCWVISGR